jgi:hypothetical protein
LHSLIALCELHWSTHARENAKKIEFARCARNMHGRAKAGHVPVWSKMGDFFEVMYQIRLDNAHKKQFPSFL